MLARVEFPNWLEATSAPMMTLDNLGNEPVNLRDYSVTSKRGACAGGKEETFRHKQRSTIPCKAVSPNARSLFSGANYKLLGVRERSAADKLHPQCCLRAPSDGAVPMCACPKRQHEHERVGNIR